LSVIEPQPQTRVNTISACVSLRSYTCVSLRSNSRIPLDPNACIALSSVNSAITLDTYSRIALRANARVSLGTNSCITLNSNSSVPLRPNPRISLDSYTSVTNACVTLNAHARITLGTNSSVTLIAVHARITLNTYARVPLDSGVALRPTPAASPPKVKPDIIVIVPAEHDAILKVVERDISAAPEPDVADVVLDHYGASRIGRPEDYQLTTNTAPIDGIKVIRPGTACGIDRVEHAPIIYRDNATRYRLGREVITGKHFSIGAHVHTSKFVVSERQP
jgi:hypothetical protein